MEKQGRRQWDGDLKNIRRRCRITIKTIIRLIPKEQMLTQQTCTMNMWN